MPTQQVAGVENIEGIAGANYLHAIQNVEEQLVCDDWPRPSIVQLNGTVDCPAHIC